MTLQEMVTAVQGAFGSRFQNSTSLVLQYLNTVQQVAFNRDIQAFLWTRDYLSVAYDVVLSSSGYTNFVATDIGKPLVGGGSGVILSYNNALNTVQISASYTGTFAGAITTTGGAGAGTFSSFSVSKGPYSWAALTPLLGSLTPYTVNAGVRKMLGVTIATDSDIYGQSINKVTSDYGFASPIFNERGMYEVVRKYDLQKALFFVNAPLTTSNYYRWVYYIRPPTIGLATDDANVLIPAEFHQTVMVEGAQALADRSTYGDKTPEQVLDQIIGPFWDSISQSYAPDGTNDNFTSEGQL